MSNLSAPSTILAVDYLPYAKSTEPSRIIPCSSHLNLPLRLHRPGDLQHFYRVEHRTFFSCLASYLAYAYWDLHFIGLLALATFRNFSHCQAPSSCSIPDSRHVFNLMILGIFQVRHFFIDSHGLSARTTNNPRCHCPAANPAATGYFLLYVSAAGPICWRLIMVGLSQSRYGGAIFALYVAFFPAILSGPIERPGPYLRRLQKTRRAGSGSALASACLCFVRHLLQKLPSLTHWRIVSMPRLPTFAARHVERSAARLLSPTAFKSMRISPVYSAIAIGVSKLFMLPAMDNFRQPDFSRTVIEFWTRLAYQLVPLVPRLPVFIRSVACCLNAGHSSCPCSFRASAIS